MMELKSARDKFHKGQRVQVSLSGHLNVGKLLEHKNTVKGIVDGFCRHPNMVHIIRDGHTYYETYNMDFWEPVKWDHCCREKRMDNVQVPDGLKCPHCGAKEQDYSLGAN